MGGISTHLGYVGIVPKGEYDPNAVYKRLDLVTRNGGSYLALGPTTGNAPPNHAYWQVIADARAWDGTNLSTARGRITGASPLSILPAPDSPLSVKVGVTTQETGTGDKSPSNPYTLAGTSAVTVTVTTGEDAETYTLTPSAPLYGLPGARDEIRNDGSVLRRTGVKIFDGTEGIGLTITQGHPRFQLYNAIPGSIKTSATSQKVSHIRCSHFPINGTPIGNNSIDNVMSGVSNLDHLYWRYDAAADAAAMKAYFAAQYAAGTPVTVVYELATPVETPHDFQAVAISGGPSPDATTPAQTTVSCDGDSLTVDYLVGSAGPVYSVNGQTGIVLLTAADIPNISIPNYTLEVADLKNSGRFSSAASFHDALASGDFKWFGIGDYWPISLTGSYTDAATNAVKTLSNAAVKLEVAGINPYWRYGDSGSLVNGEHHVMLTSRDLFPNTLKFRSADTTWHVAPDPANGVGVWQGSALYATLNDATNGIIALVEETDIGAYIYGGASGCGMRYFGETRDTEAATTSGGAWMDRGKLFLPTEDEVWGRSILAINSFQCHMQLPIFQGTRLHVSKCLGEGGNRNVWWLTSAAEGSASNICYVSSRMQPTAYKASEARGVPLCFLVV